MREYQTCPVRTQLGREKGLTDPDWWEEYYQSVWELILVKLGLGVRRRACSYCGGMHPDNVMKALESGWVSRRTNSIRKWTIEDEDQETTKILVVTPHLTEEEFTKLRAVEK